MFHNWLMFRVPNTCSLYSSNSMTMHNESCHLKSHIWLFYHLTFQTQSFSHIIKHKHQKNILLYFFTPYYNEPFSSQVSHLLPSKRLNILLTLALIFFTLLYKAFLIIPSYQIPINSDIILICYTFL